MVSASVAQRPSFWTRQIPGPARPVQSASRVQGLHVVGDAQTGVVAGQSALVTHVTQVPLAAQTALVASRLAHAPAPVGACPQPTQEPVAPQNGLVAS